MTTYKHAYLIMAHNNFYCLDKLIDMISDESNDIYLHIDKKADIRLIDNYPNIKKAIILKKRIDVRWGTYSLIKTELLLMENALKNGPYAYYHVLSGSDLPIKKQEYIKNFFLDNNNNYINYKNELSISDKQRITIYQNIFRQKNKLTNWMEYKLKNIQNNIKLDRTQKYLKGYIIKKGSEWCSITNDAVKLIIQNKNFIKKICKFTSCADEIYKQIILLNSSLPICNNDLRHINWQGGYTLKHTLFLIFIIL